MNTLLIQNRAILVLGGAVKAFSYLYLFLFPGKRFTIPPVTPPRRTPAGEQKIPRIIWQTNFTDRVTLPIYLNYLFNCWISPDYEHRFVSTEARGEFIRANYPPEIYNRYMRIRIGAAQADYWRVLVLQRLGGVYLDLDGQTVTALGRIVRPEDTEVFLRMNNGELSNYFIASVPDNPSLEKIIRRISENIDEGTDPNVFTLTGPGAFNAVLDAKAVRAGARRYTAVQGCFTNEHFQYLDKPQGKWTREQGRTSILSPKTEQPRPE